MAAIRRIIDNAPVPRARLFDLLAQAQSKLESAIAERMHRPAGDLLVAMTARITFAVFQIVWETWWAGDHDVPPSTIVDDVLGALSNLELVIPAPPPRHGTDAPVP